LTGIIAAIIVSVLVILYEVPRLSKKKLWKELWVFSVLLAIAVMLNVAESLHIPIPNPLDLITIIYKPMSKIFFTLLV
jgi:hypothetical protein